MGALAVPRDHTSNSCRDLRPRTIPRQLGYPTCMYHRRWPIIWRTLEVTRPTRIMDVRGLAVLGDRRSIQHDSFVVGTGDFVQVVVGRPQSHGVSNKVFGTVFQPKISVDFVHGVLSKSNPWWVDASSSS